MESKISKSEAQAGGQNLRKTFDRKVLLQTTALRVEAVEPHITRALPAFYTLMAAGAATFFGAWQHIPETYRPYCFIPIAIGCLIPFFKRSSSAGNRPKNPFSIPKTEALKVLDRNSGDKTLPASMIAAEPSEGATESHKETLRTYQEEKLRDTLDKIQVSKPRLQTSRFAAVTAIALTAVFGLAVITAGDQRAERLSAAFDFTPPEQVVPAPKLWAAITPPEGIRQIPTLYLADKIDPAEIHKVHPRSTLEILSFDREAKITIGGEPLELDKVLTSDTGQKTYKFKAVTLGGNFCADGCTVKVENGQEWPLAMNTDLPPTITINGVEVANNNEQGNLQLRCKAKDDYGIKEGQLVMETPDKNDAADPPEQVKLPQIQIAGANFCP